MLHIPAHKNTQHPAGQYVPQPQPQPQAQPERLEDEDHRKARELLESIIFHDLWR